MQLLHAHFIDLKKKKSLLKMLPPKKSVTHFSRDVRSAI